LTYEIFYVIRKKIKEIVMDKMCNKCGIKKDIMYFDRDDRSKTGYKPICKICVSEIIKQYNESKNKE
jgi:superfamily II helicase